MIVDLTGRMLFAALVTGVTVASLAALIFRPTKRLAPRVRPYTVISRTSLGRSPDVIAFGSAAGAIGAGSLRQVFGPILESLANRVGRLMDSGSEEAVLIKLRQAGMYHNIPEHQRLAEYRVRLLGSGLLGGAIGIGVGVVLGSSTLGSLLFGGLGFFGLVARKRGSLDTAIEDRQARMRIEIYTVNQLVAMHIRVGGGVVQAVQQLVDRGNGDVIDEMAEALRLHRNGMPASEAFERAAELTPERNCARTYSLLAAAEERGSDLAGALLALSEDVREGRREALKRAATRRKAAMLLPTIAILAPILLLFVAAPIPSILFGL